MKGSTALKALGLIGLGLQLSGCAALPLAVAIGSNAFLAAGAISGMNAQERACASMTPAERQQASVQDRIGCERVWAQTSGSTAPDCERADRRIADWRRQWRADPSARFGYNANDVGCPSVQQAFRDRGMTPPGGFTYVSTPRR
ncbi:hypothetical protein K2Q16_01095 [Patescibacteria group bacterium]|nr:hypothetical protein [Patescibacteria group bacterium]